MVSVTLLPLRFPRPPLREKSFVTKQANGVPKIAKNTHTMGASETRPMMGIVLGRVAEVGASVIGPALQLMDSACLEGC